MQSAEFHRNSLPLALRSYSSAVGRMERTVLLPSLLRDVPADEEPARDLYGDYLMLKAVRSAVESGLAHPEDNGSKVPVDRALPDLEPESLLRFHLSGLFAVVSQLTRRSHRLTQKYLDIIGISN
ncbi:thyroid hormone-inducible hepatic protein [Vanacampus margaritifer]